ncbi:hypothetical protein [Rhizobium sp. Rhizsp42]|uniref:hypothetical protein n=1 Tax=Rhizobium sp. Rhizsp42 TaxID=3243034 RepID=UPI000FC2BBAD
MIDKNARLEELLEAMIAENETITARAIVRRSGDVFKNATDITRNVDRRAKFEAAQLRQETIRAAIDRSSKKSRSELERLVEVKNDDIGQLKADRELLISSHRMMIHAVAQMGGRSKWKQFFEEYDVAINKLHSMDAIPTGEVVTLPPRKS